MEGGGVRLHVGGLGGTVGRDDLLKIFSPMGSVDSVEFVRTKGRSFAYIDFSPSSTNSLTKLFSTYNGCVWKGGRLRLEKAKEHYMARLKREWEESSASDFTIRESSDSSFTASTHLNVFFPRLRKVKAVPLSGTGKHKYSFQRVPVPSLPKSFCDCEEHSTSLTPRETHVQDLEALNVGVNEDEVNIMNSVMNKLFQKSNLPNTEQVLEKDSAEQVPMEDSAEMVSEEDSEIEDNLIINVVSSGKSMRNTELDILSRKRKSISNERTASEECSEARKGNHIYPTKKRQSNVLEVSEKQEPAQAILEKKTPSGRDLDKSADESIRAIGVKRSSDNISWSQKSSWKALMANGNKSNFSVSSFLPDVGSSKAVQPASRNTDLARLPENSKELDVPTSAARSTVTAKIKKIKNERLTSTNMAGNSPVLDDIERNDTTAIGAIGAIGLDNSEMRTDTVTDAEDPDNSDSMESESLELVGSSEDDSKNDELSVEADENVTEDLNAEEERLVLKENMDDDDYVDKEEPLKTCNKSAGGPSWLQRASWTQLVSDKNASFSITQFFPDLNTDKCEVARLNNNEDCQFSNSNKNESGMEQKDSTSSTGGFAAVTSLEEYRQCLKSKNANEGCRLAAKKPLRRKIGSVETCTFMRSSTSLKEWAKAKKALGEPRRKKKSEE